MKRVQGGRVVDYDPFTTEVQVAPTATTSGTTGYVGWVSVPAGTVTDVLDWVGDDEDRRRAALAAELAADSPRKTLVERLT